MFFCSFAAGESVCNLPYESFRVPVWVAIVICASGIAWRVWGASYLGVAVVYDSKIVTSALCTSGPYRYTRNPLYFGLIVYAVGIALIGTWLTVVLLATSMICLSVALIAGEERSLRARFGERFDAFARAVPRLVPSLRPRVLDGGARPSLRVGLRAEAGVIALAFIAFSCAILQW